MSPQRWDWSCAVFSLCGGFSLCCAVLCCAEGLPRSRAWSQGGDTGCPGMGQGQTAALEVKAGKCAAACWPPTPPAPDTPKMSWSSVLKVEVEQCCSTQPGAWIISGLFCVSQILFSRGSQSTFQIVGNFSFYCPFQATKCYSPFPWKQSWARGSCLASADTPSAAEAGR